MYGVATSDVKPVENLGKLPFGRDNNRVQRNRNKIKIGSIHVTDVSNY